MKEFMLFTFVFISLTIVAQNVDDEKQLIRTIIQTSYVEGLQNEGDANKIDQGFHPDFKLLGIDKAGRMWVYSITDWKAKQVNKRYAGELPLSNEKQVSVKFKSIDISGTAAVVKLEYYIGLSLTYIDYISLYKFDDGWKMVNKTFNKVNLK